MVSIVVQFRSYPALIVDFYVSVNVWSRTSSICGILYNKNTLADDGFHA